MLSPQRYLLMAAAMFFSGVFAAETTDDIEGDDVSAIIIPYSTPSIQST